MSKDNTYFNLTFCPNNIAKEMKSFIYGVFYTIYL